MSDRKNVKNGVGRATHRNIQAHCVLKGVLGGDGTGQNRIIIIVVVRTAHINNAVASFQEELLALNLRGQGGAVTGKRQANGLVQAVHGICGEHTSARSTGRAGIRFDACQFIIGHRVIDSHDHGIDEVKAVLNNAFNRSAGFHRTTRDEDRRDVQTHGGDEHTGGDLVAVRDAHQCIGAVSVDHVFDRICNHLTRGQRVKHAVVAHCDAVVNSDGVKFLRNTACFANRSGDQVAHVLEVDVAGNELGVGVGDRDNRLAEIPIRHSGRTPERTCSGHIASLSRCC